MNFEEIEEDIKSLQKSVAECNITDAKTYEGAQRFSQSVSSITIWLNKLMATLAESNKAITAKMAAYERKPASSNPPPNACVACKGSGKASNGSACKPCNGTGKKIMSEQPKGGLPAAGSPEPAQNPPIQASAPKAVPAPSSSFSLDDFDDDISEEDALTAELQKTLF
jgi:hypothetical protein